MRMPIWLYGLFALLAIVIVALLLSNAQYRKQSDKQTAQIADIKKNLTNEIARQARYNRKYSLECLPYYVTGEEGTEVPLRSLMSDTPKLFFRISETHCSACIEAELSRIGKLAEKVGRDNIVFLVSYNSNHALHILKRNYGIMARLYNIPEEKMQLLDVEKLHTPYFFVADKRGVYNFFVPEKSLTFLSDIYYENIAASFADIQ